MTKKTRILIADDHPVIVEGIKNILEAEEGIEVVGCASDGLQAIQMAESLQPDIIILDVSMPKMDGVKIAFHIKKMNKTIKILIYSMTATREQVSSLFRAGISAYVLKDESITELLSAVQAVRKGATFYSETVRNILQDHMLALELGKEGKDIYEIQNGIVRLSAREKEVFILLADGLSIKKIAERLYISPKTVESHKYNIMDKLHVDTLAGLTKIAVKKDLIDV